MLHSVPDPNQSLPSDLNRIGPPFSRAVKYPSDTYQVAKMRRLRRIKRRAVPELIAAFEHGELSLRQFDSLSRLRPRQQKRRIAERQQQLDAALVAAQTIEEILDQTKAGTPICLAAIGAALRDVLLRNLERSPMWRTSVYRNPDGLIPPANLRLLSGRINH